MEPRILESDGIPGPEFWSPVEFLTSGTQNSGVWWNARSGGLEFWSPVEFQVSGTQNSGVQWNARSGVLEAGGILG